MRRDEHGYIVVETIGAFMLFVLLIVSILSLVSIVTLQARVHYAMTQAAQTLSMYSYVFEITGLAEQFTDIGGKADSARINVNELKTNINGVFEGIDSLSVGGTGKSAAGAAKSGYDLFSSPANLVNLLIDDAKNALFSEFVIKPLVGRYLSNGALSGDEYLKSMNVPGGLKGLHFCGFDYFDLSITSDMNSALIDKDGNIKLIVRYKVSYVFGALPLPFTELSVTQSVQTKAWLGGKGPRYEP